ncbi:MAG: DNA polymerase III subunit beta [Candidatus Hydrogenedentes bacterium]|nr:DNA polymerase III subunit beta [Candidatus Hydrogenedentota bacterium]
MKIIIPKQELLKAVNTVKSIVSQKSALPILSHILMEADDNKLKLTTTDLKVSIECVVECTVEVTGSLTVSSQRLSMILGELPDEDVTLELLEANIVELRCGKKVETKLFSISPDEYPPVRDFEGIEPIVFNQSVLKKLFQRTSFAICTDQSRYNLTGLLLETRSDGLRVVATDGRRMSFAVSDEDIPTDREIKVIIPSKMIRELESLLEDNSEKIVKVYLDSNQASFLFDHVRVVTALIEGNFPNYEAVVPKKHDKEIIINLQKFMESMRRAYAMTNDKFRNVKLTFSEGKLLLTVKTPEVGDYKEELPISYENDTFDISFNPLFVIDVLRYMDSENVCMQLKDGSSPGVFKPYIEAPVDTYVNVVMPIRS